MLGVTSSDLYPFRTFIPDWVFRDPENHPEGFRDRLLPPTIVPETLHPSPWVRKLGFRWFPKGLIVSMWVPRMIQVPYLFPQPSSGMVEAVQDCNSWITPARSKREESENAISGIPLVLSPLLPLSTQKVGGQNQWNCTSMSQDLQEFWILGASGGFFCVFDQNSSIYLWKTRFLVQKVKILAPPAVKIWRWRE